MRTRIFRALVCLVLVLSLLVQVSPIRARAAGPNFFFVDPELQLASDLIGLGISVGTDAAAHNEVIQDAADWLAETGEWLSEGMLKVYKVAAAAGGYKYMVDGDFLQELFDWAWDMEVVTVSGETLEFEGISAGLGNSASLYWAGSNYSISSDVPFAAYKVALYWESQYGNYNPSSFLAFIDDTGYYTFNGSTRKISSYAYKYGDMYIVHLGSWSTHETLDDYNKCTGFVDLGVQYYSDIRSFFEHFGGAVSSGNSVSTDKDLVLNHVGVFGSILPDAYPEWFQNSTTITDTETGEEKTVVPIGLGQTVTETQGMSQAGIWAGTSTYVDTETDVGTGDDTITVPETVTLKDILTGILSVPKSIAEAVAGFFADVVAAVKAIPAAITEFFTISTDVSAFAIEWRDFFPFCIPFDIYDFLTLLMAEPEAPKFEWEIDLLKTGEPYLMVVDLSEWDDVAQLLRRLELLLFIVGLAMVTREKYIRG